MQGKLDINGYTIEYIVNYKKVKNINMHVKKNHVAVTMSKRVSQAYLEIVLAKKVNFIKGAMERLNASEAMQSDYRVGGAVKLGGKSFVIAHRPSGSRLAIEGDSLIYGVEYINEQIIRQMFLELMADKSKEFVERAIKNIFPNFQALGISMPKIIMKNMVSLWGSCKIKANTIVLNKALGMVSYLEAEYIVAHELAHFIVPNHSKAFHNVLDKILPDNRALSKSLKGYDLRRCFR